VMMVSLETFPLIIWILVVITGTRTLTGYCDITKRRCVIELEKQEKKFTNCFIDRLDPFSVQYFYDYFNVNSDDGLYQVHSRNVSWLIVRHLLTLKLQ